MNDADSLVRAAACAAASATAELARCAYEGAGLNALFESETIEQLLDAAKMAIEASAAAGESDEGRGQIYAALVKHLEGWA